MADYYPLLARAISGLPENTGEQRRIVYERARAALLAQLRGADPPLPDAEVTRERLALEEAVRRVESEYAAMAAGSFGAARAPAPPAERPVYAAAETLRAPEPARSEPDWQPEDDMREADPPVAERPHATIRPGLAPRGRGGAPAPAEDLRAERERPAPSPRATATREAPAREMPTRDIPSREAAAREAVGEDRRRGRGRPGPRDEEEDEASGSGWGRIIMLLVVMAVIGAAGALGYTQREQIIAFIRDMRAEDGPVTAEPQRQAPQEVPKSTDRITQAPSDPARHSSQPGPVGADAATAAVAQRAVLFEENPGGGEQGLQQFAGNVVWKTQTVDPGNGLPPDTAIGATVEIPDRQLKVDITFRRNQDSSLPASHIIEVQFSLPENFDLGNVANIPGMRAKASEAAQGVPLAGLAVRVTPGFFLIGLSAQEIDRQRNLGLLITRNWLDLPMVFSNGRRGILVLEKGLPGDRAFREAFQSWGLPLPPEQGEQPAQQPQGVPLPGAPGAPQ